MNPTEWAKDCRACVCLWVVRESVVQEGGEDGAFSARVQNRRFRTCGGRADMLGRRVCRRLCNMQNMTNTPVER